MKTINILFTFCVLFGFISCQKNDSIHISIDDIDKYIKPKIAAIPSHNHIILTYKPGSLIPESHKPTPDYYEVYQSENLSGGYQMIDQFSYDEFNTYDINPLLNNSALPYFYMIAYKNGIEPVYSDTIMAMKGKKTKRENVLFVPTSESFEVNHISYSFLNHKVGYYQQSYQNPPKALFIKDLMTEEIIELDQQCDSYCWSNSGSFMLVSSKDVSFKGELTGISQFVLFNIETSEKIYLTEDINHQANPIFSSDDKKILYEIIEGNSMADRNPFNIASMDLETKETELLLNQPYNENFKPKYPTWGNNKVIFEGTDKGKRCIYEASFLDKNMKKVLDNQNWEDWLPSVSPDKRCIVFLSNRSGSVEVWYYEFETSQLRILDIDNETVKTYISTISPDVSEETDFSGFSRGNWNYKEGDRMQWIDNSTLYLTKRRYNQIAKITIP